MNESWKPIKLEEIEFVLYISKCLAERQVEFVTCMLQSHALTVEHTSLDKRSGIAITQPWEDLKKLLKEELWDHVMIGADVDKYGSFDVIIGMGWLSKLRATIVCYEKVVQNPLSNRDILEVHGECPKGNLKQLKTMKVNEPKLEDILVVCEFPSVFSREVKFHIDLIPEAMPVAKSPYRLAPTEMQELPNQLKELKEKGKANVVADALSRQERLKLRLILVAQNEEGYFYIVERVGPVAYRLRLPQELVGVHDTFYVSNLKKYLADVNLQVPLEEVKIDDKLHFVEEPMEIIDREVKKLKKSRIPIVKVRWNF
nr:reverse transcriptase domain-containing protein [Tanacetum cinerariifolium]